VLFRSCCDQAKKLIRSDNGDAFVLFQSRQVPISGDDMRCFSGNGTLDDFVIIRVIYDDM